MTRLVGKWDQAYLGPRLYRCEACGKADLTHDDVYRHVQFTCPERLKHG